MLADFAALGRFEGVLRDAIHALKYERMTALAAPLGRLMAEQVAAQGWPSGLVLPVPMHDSRLQARGYNQAALLGREVAHHLGWAFDDMQLVRERATPSQVGLNYDERRANVHGAFSTTNPDAVHGAHILLVDDVFTTGATINECVVALLAAGGVSVRAVVAGRAGIAGHT